MTFHSLKKGGTRGKFALQAMASTNGRLAKEKQQDTGDWSANLAASWAASLQTLLTQIKGTELNNTLVEKKY